MYWLGQRGYFPDIIPTSVVCAELIYFSTSLILAIQILGLFNPTFTCEIAPLVEKEHPLKRIKESMFFILFNLTHVFILIGGPFVAPQYLMMFLQIYTFFEM